MSWFHYIRAFPESVIMDAIPRQSFLQVDRGPCSVESLACSVEYGGIGIHHRNIVLI